MEISLTQNKIAIIDDADYELVKNYKWSVSENYRKWYARAYKNDNGRYSSVLMHRLILSNECKGKQIDHINHDGLDNRRSNLRVCTNAENHRNQRKRENTSSKYKGVIWQKKDKIWEARIKVDGKNIYLGRFKSEEDAASAYAQAAKKYWGAFAYQNPVRGKK